MQMRRLFFLALISCALGAPAVPDAYGAQAEEAQVINSVPSPVEDEWTQLEPVISPSEVTGWKDAGFTPSSAREWKEAGFEPSHAKEWLDAGIPPSEAKMLRRYGGNIPSEARRLAMKFKRFCPKGIEPIDALFQSSPSSVSDRCFEYEGKTLQLQAPTKGLFTASGMLFYLDFGESPAKAGDFHGIVKGVGVHRYRGTSGISLVIPFLKVIHEII